MKVNNFNQNFGARIIVNDSFKKAVEATRDANYIGCFNQTAQFINALQAIKNTHEFDTFEIIAQTEEEGAKVGYSSVHPYEIKINGKHYESKDMNQELFNIFGEHQGACAIAGIVGFANDFFGSDFKLPIAKNHEKYKQIYADIEQHKKQISALERDAARVREAVVSEYEIKLNKLI